MRASSFLAFASVIVFVAAIAQEPNPKVAQPAPVATVSDVVDDEALLVRIEQACDALRSKGSLRASRELLAAASAGPVAAPQVPLATATRTPVELRKVLSRSVLLVGEHYRCDECDAWHCSMSTGFAVGADGLVATCLHVLEDDPAVADAESPMLFVAGLDGRVFPILEIVARDPRYDLAIVRCAAKGLAPLPLRGDVELGERVYCLSHPDHMFATFSEGLVSRRYVVRGPAPGTLAPVAEDGAPDHNLGKALAEDDGDPRAFLQVSCEFGGGSSGAPIVDSNGNVVGVAQSTATVFADPEAELPEAQMVPRTASPASALLGLLRR